MAFFQFGILQSFFYGFDDCFSKVADCTNVSVGFLALLLAFDSLVPFGYLLYLKIKQF